jgi:hypothetical protein
VSSVAAWNRLNIRAVTTKPSDHSGTTLNSARNSDTWIGTSRPTQNMHREERRAPEMLAEPLAILGIEDNDACSADPQQQQECMPPTVARAFADRDETGSALPE